MSGSSPTRQESSATHLYRGEEFDADLGMYNLRARYYNPDRGRFWTRDSFEGFVGDPQSHHRYAYAQNNPVNRIDPSGHYSLSEAVFSLQTLPIVRQSMDSVVLGVNSFSYGLAGGYELKAVNHASGLFIQGLVPETGVYLGRQNFVNTIEGAPFLLTLNPYTYIPQYDCFTCEKVGFGAYGAFFGSVARFPAFQFEESPLASEVASWMRGDPIRNGWNAAKDKFIETGDNIGFLLARVGGYGEYYEGSSQLYQNIKAAPQNYDADKIQGEIAWGTLKQVASIGSLGGSDVALAGYDAWQTGDVSGLENASGGVLLGALGGKVFGMPRYGIAGAGAQARAALSTLQRGLEAARSLKSAARAVTQELQRLWKNRCLSNLTLAKTQAIYGRDAAERMFVANAAKTGTPFDSMLAKVNKLDFSTPANKAIFYSGPGQGARAAAFAERTGGMTIEMTAGGRTLATDSIFQSLSPAEQFQVWQRASVPFAQGASGRINAFIRGARPDRTFRGIEEPILNANPKVYRSIYHY